ncbi:nucleotidyltransferase domain-containing protein [Paenarthrobacter sp. NPDC092416]|uniref:nucleotidyltransferase domain-containing protein n=1 Tax=Paenarthrobacter sp. NPDC092416 TaxID=3364386 RepID=UPI0037FA9E41
MMRLQNPLTTISPTLDMGVLYVLARADADFTAPSISKLLPERASLAGVRKALVRLVDQGIVLESVAGRTHIYRLNRGHLLAEPVEAMAATADRLAERIRSEIELWKFMPIVVTIFGSAARNDTRTDSDIDIFIALGNDVEELVAETAIAELATKMSVWTGNDTRPLVYREAEIGPWPIFESITTEGFTVYGDSTWLDRAIHSSGVSK